MIAIILILIGLSLELIAVYLQGSSLKKGLKSIVSSNIKDIKKNPKEIETEESSSIINTSIKNKLGIKPEKTSSGELIRRFTVENYEKLQETIKEDQFENRIPGFIKNQLIIFMFIFIGIIFQVVGISLQQLEFMEILHTLEDKIIYLQDRISELEIFIHVGK